MLRRLRGDALKVEIFALSDPVGPAGTDAKLDAIILTQEVAKGGEMVNEARAANGLPAVEQVFVDMILVTEDEEDADGSQKKTFSNKMSSTLVRQHLMAEREQKQ